jgi:tripartite-type tricarboxylate transporter receptor subunit TctC
MKSRMHFPALTLLVALFAASAVIYGDTYPNKPIRMIVPYSPGGTGDNIARAVGGELAKLLGQQIINDNRPGAGGNIGADIAAKAEPDGYTLVMAATSLASNPSLQKKMSFDPLKDLTPVSQCCEVPMIVVVHPSLPIKSIKDLIAYAKANPGKLSFSSSGIGTSSHLAAELFKVLAKVDMVHVPYKADAQALPDLLAGQVNLMFMFQTSALPQIKADKLRPLAVSTKKRSPLLPDLPTVAEAGVPGYEFSGWFGIFARAGTPKERIEKLSAANIKALQAPELKERLLQQGAIPIATTPEQFTAFFRGEVEKWARVVKEGGLELID